ncbi:MAG: competence/damage-inducible protein A [Clostridia bacterium]|nr:competence/damage-inducible protein A [Clostridia bacterium]
MNISILAVGTELLMGKTVNTNATYLSEQINALGHNVLYHLTVGDNPVRLKDTLNYLLEHSDMVVTTGGLGPTQDDLTKEVICETLDLKMEKHDLAYNMLIERFKQFNVEMTSNNIKQAYLPIACIPMMNQKGTAPGFIAEKDGKYIAVLPGPPYEMKHMYENSLRPFLEELSDSVIMSEYIHLFGIGESSAESVIDDLITDQSDPTIAMYASVGQVSIRVTSKANDFDTCYERIQNTTAEIVSRLEPYVIGFGETSLLDETIKLLHDNYMTVALAESCTGGMLASELIQFPGASQYFDLGLVTYSNESKMNLLKVEPDILETYGAVSAETCEAMLHGLRHLSFSDVLVSVTGIAGPTGGTPDKPVGLVYIGIMLGDSIQVKKFNFTGDRLTIRKRSMLNAINMIREALKP